MTSTRDREVEAVLREIVEEHGEQILSNPTGLRNLLSDLLPDNQKDSSLLVTAAEVDVVGTLRRAVDDGIDVTTAIARACNILLTLRHVNDDQSDWVVTRFAVALGYDPGAPASADSTDPAEPFAFIERASVQQNSDLLPDLSQDRTPAQEQHEQHDALSEGGECAESDESNPSFPFDDYEDLRLSEILPVLDELQREQLAAVQARELSGKRRGTILRRIAALTDGPTEAARDSANLHDQETQDAPSTPSLGLDTSEHTSLSSPSTNAMPSKRRKGGFGFAVSVVVVMVVGVAVAIVVISTRGGHAQPGSPTDTTSPAPMPITATSPAPIQMLAASLPDQSNTNPAGNLNLEDDCTDVTSSESSRTGGLSAAIVCGRIPGLTAYDLEAESFGSEAALNEAVRVITEDTVGSSPDGSPMCPPSADAVYGKQPWSGKAFPPASNQTLYCFEHGQAGATYLWVLPAKNTLYELYGGDSLTSPTNYALVNAFWQQNGQPTP